VRSCDGYAFPLSNAPNGRESADEMCQALCPGTETAAYAMPGGDDALNQAISIRTNRPYVQSPNAFKFQKSFDPACSCKKQGESWAQLLRQAESMLDQRRGDIIVTEQKAEELSRPKAAPPLTAAQQREQDRRLASRRVNDAAEAQAAARRGPRHRRPTYRASECLGCRTSGVSSQADHRAARPVRDDPQGRRPRPFLSRDESEHDAFGAGHASTASQRRSGWRRRTN
jgi:hypothetical protein